MPVGGINLDLILSLCREFTSPVPAGGQGEGRMPILFE